MRILSLDIGTKRIGVAISDPMGWTAQPLETVQVAKDGAWLTRIATLCTEHDITQLVAGVPLEMSGRAGLSARRVRKTLAQVAELTGFDILEIDERLTTRQAERALIEGDMRRKKRKKVIDQLAAVLILQGHLNFLRQP